VDVAREMKDECGFWILPRRMLCRARQPNVRREIHAQLRQIDGKWRFTAFRDEAVLVK